MFDLLVDLANVCRDRRLGGDDDAAWHRFDRVMDFWRDHINADSRALLVADESLARDFRTDEARQRWARLVRSGQLVAVPEADVVLLQKARETGAGVLSRDGFVGHRRVHGWIQGDAEHFWRWRVHDDGRLDIRLEQMPVAGDYTIDRAEERDLLKARGFKTIDLTGGALAAVYRCITPGCPASTSDVLQDVPLRRGERMLCPSCGHALVDLGPRPRARELLIVNSESELADVRLADGQQVVLGRISRAGCIDLSQFVACPHISQRHARVSVRGGQVVVEDMQSTNGTRVQRWSPQGRAWAVEEHVHEPLTLLARDRIALPDEIYIEQTGVRYVVPDYL